MKIDIYETIAKRVLTGSQSISGPLLYHPPINMSPEWPAPESRAIQFMSEFTGALDADIESLCQTGPIRNLLKRKVFKQILSDWGLGVESTCGMEANRFGEWRRQYRRYLYVVDYQKFYQMRSDFFEDTCEPLFLNAVSHERTSDWQDNLMYADPGLPQSD